MRWCAVSVLAVGVLGFAGCGSDSPTSDDARDVASSFLTAAASSNPSGCDLLSDAALTKNAAAYGDPAADPAATCKAALEKQGQGPPVFNAPLLRAAAAGVESADVNIHGDSATVQIATQSGGEDATVTVTLTADGSEWQVDDYSTFPSSS